MPDVILDTKELDRIIKDFPYNAEQVIVGVAFDLEKEAKENVQRVGAIDTGAMRASIFTRTKRHDLPVMQMSEVASRRPGARIVELTKPEGDILASVGPTVDYGVYVEFGTHKMEARPYLTPAVETISKKFKKGETYKNIFKARMPEAKP